MNPTRGLFESPKGTVIDYPQDNPPKAKASFGEDFRRFFVRGMAALLPTLITLWLLMKIWEFLWEYLGQHIIWLLSIVYLRLMPDKVVGLVRWEWRQSHWLASQFIGVGLAIILVYFVGLLVGNFIGRTVWRLSEVALMRMPLIRAIYPSVKQVTDFLLAERSAKFVGSRVVAVEPHANGIWSVGLVTGSGLRSLSQAVEQEMVTVFVPSSPTAFSGYVMVVPRSRVIELPLTVEEAMRLLVSGGVISPGEEKAGSPPSGALPSIRAVTGAEQAADRPGV